FRGKRFSLFFRYSYRHSHFYTPHKSSRSCFAACRKLSYHYSKGIIHSFGDTLSPGTFSAQSHSTSELLRTLLVMAASKPTYWLSKQLHILFHLAYTLGP